MIWHDNELVQLDIREFAAERCPFLTDNRAGLIQDYFAVRDTTEVLNPMERAEGDEIAAWARIVKSI
jgi:hypothetical protein